MNRYSRYTYKAKRKDNQEWVYGSLIIEKSSSMCLQEYGIPFIETYYIYTIEDGNNHYSKIEIKKETLCQCTGLQDIEGNYIFENDIVKYVYEPNDSGFRANEKGIITYKNTGFHYETIKGTNKYGSRSGWLPSIPNDDGKLFKIVKNKFDEVIK